MQQFGDFSSSINTPNLIILSFGTTKISASKYQTFYFCQFYLKVKFDDSLQSNSLWLVKLINIMKWRTSSRGLIWYKLCLDFLEDNEDTIISYSDSTVFEICNFLIFYSISQIRFKIERWILHHVEAYFKLYQCTKFYLPRFNNNKATCYQISNCYFLKTWFGSCDWPPKPNSSFLAEITNII